MLKKTTPIKSMSFIPALAQALRSGAKTSTRRLASGHASRLKVGTKLYVAESWHVRTVATDVVEIGYPASMKGPHSEYVEQVPVEFVKPGSPLPMFPKNGTSNTMPLWASRMWIEITGVRFEKLHEITEEQALTCGIYQQEWEGAPAFWMPGLVAPVDATCARDAYKHLWGQLYHDASRNWEANPDVVALDFDVHLGNIEREGV